MNTPLKTVKSAPKLSFLDYLQLILDKAKDGKDITIREIFKILAGKGYAALLIIFSLPFCLPVQIPGFSTPFGIILAFIGLRIAFAKKPWWPHWILEKKLTSNQVESLMSKTVKVVKVVQKVLHPRLTFLITNPILHRMHGIVVFFLSLLLSLPLPIPFTNLLTALPLLSIGLGLLEDDGVFIIIGYVLSTICFLAFIGLFFLGKEQLARLF